jgi:hypothetical protein
MDSMNKVAVLILIMPIALSEKSLTAGQDPMQEPYKILFIGSSYFAYNNLPGLFENLADHSGKSVNIDQQITVGFYLHDHANSSSTEAKINEQDWDYVILQGVGRITAYPDIYLDHPVRPALMTLRDKISENCESTKMVFCLPWAYEDGMTWLEGWTDTYEDMQIKIFENTLLYSDEVGFAIAPVGWAWYKVLEEKNYPLHYLHMSDWNHPSLKGSYLMACVIFSTVFVESSVGIHYFGGLSEQEANYFQTVGSNTVLDSLDLWNITTTYIINGEHSVPRKLDLHQNYPNPFNPVTRIKYALPDEDFISIKIYNTLGREVTTLVEEFQAAGSHEIIFNASRLQSGIYVYKLQTRREVQMRKCIFIK